MSINEKLYCSPKNSVYAFNDSTCFSLKDLKLIASEYNKNTKNNKIKITGTKKELLENIRKKFADKCGDEQYCWTSLGFIDEKYKKHFENVFRSEKPKEWYNNKNTWLNTLDILACMKQYQHLYKDFTFLGVYPIDGLFKTNSGVCYGNKMCDFSIKKMKKNITQFALVLNTDTHEKKGEHWIALYCNINPKKENFGIYFYDSVGTQPPIQVKQFMEKIKTQMSEQFPSNIFKNFELRSNVIPAQFKGFDCGIFAQVFITQMVKYIPYDSICKKMKNDDDINKLRNILYRPNLSK